MKAEDVKLDYARIQLENWSFEFDPSEAQNPEDPIDGETELEDTSPLDELLNALDELGNQAEREGQDKYLIIKIKGGDSL